MKLENLNVQKLSTEEQLHVKGGYGALCDWAVGEAISAVVNFIAYDNEGYGRRMHETGSPGGHK